MKQYILIFLLAICSSLTFAQNLNQFDGDGERHGVWKKNFDKTKVTRYQGEFNHGKEIGLFKFYKNINGEAVLTATKQFNNDNSITQVKFFASNGKVISEGQVNGKKNIGTWTYYHNKKNQVLSTDNYNDEGLLQGERLVYYDNGQVAQKELYNKGKLDGLSIWYFKNGKVNKEFNYVEGLLHGASNSYDSFGNLEVSGQYQSDRKHGIWKYYQGGKVVEEKDFTRRTKSPYKKK